MPATAVRLLWSHWPTLLALFLGGFLLREGVVWIATWASRFEGVAGLLVLPLAPLATLTSMVLMLIVLRSSLPAARALSSGDERPGRGRLVHSVVSVLLPFLAVYAAAGYLDQDRLTYSIAVADAAQREMFSAITTGAEAVSVSERLATGLGPTVIAVVVLALVARRLLERFEHGRDLPAVGLATAYLEALWVLIAAVATAGLVSRLFELVGQHRLIIDVDQWWSAFVFDLGAVGDALAWAVRGLGAVAVDAATVLLVPFAWLAVGAVVYGYQRRAASLAINQSQAVARRWAGVPTVVRRWLIRSTVEPGGRFTPLVDGLAMVVRAGVVPLVFFALLFVVAEKAGEWTWLLVRGLIGPQEIAFWFAFDEPISVVGRAIALVLQVCLLAAAVDRVVAAEGSLQPPALAETGNEA